MKWLRYEISEIHRWALYPRYNYYIIFIYLLYLLYYYNYHLKLFLVSNIRHLNFISVNTLYGIKNTFISILAVPFLHNILKQLFGLKTLFHCREHAHCPALVIFFGALYRLKWNRCFILHKIGTGLALFILSLFNHQKSVLYMALDLLNADHFHRYAYYVYRCPPSGRSTDLPNFGSCCSVYFTVQEFSECATL